MYALARTRNRRCESWFSHKASTIVGAPPPEVHSGEDENRPQKVCMVKSVHGKRNAHPSANELSRTAHDKKNTSTTNLTPKVQQLCTTCTFTDNRHHGSPPHSRTTELTGCGWLRGDTYIEQCRSMVVVLSITPTVAIATKVVLGPRWSFHFVRFVVKRK